MRALRLSRDLVGEMERRLHIGPVAQKGNSEASCLGVESSRLLIGLTTAQGGVALPRDGLLMHL